MIQTSLDSLLFIFLFDHVLSIRKSPSFFHSTSQLNPKVLIEFERLDLRQRSWFSSAIFCESKRPTSIQKSDLNLDNTSVTACAYISGKITVFQRNRIFPKFLVSAYTLVFVHQRQMALQMYKTCADMFFFLQACTVLVLLIRNALLLFPLGSKLVKVYRKHNKQIGPE